MPLLRAGLLKGLNPYALLTDGVFDSASGAWAAKPACFFNWHVACKCRVKELAGRTMRPGLT